MQAYQSNKIVHAEPMSSEEFAQWRTENPDKDMNHSPMKEAVVAGYHVVYNLGKDDEYHSWSPQSAFDGHNTPISVRALKGRPLFNSRPGVLYKADHNVEPFFDPSRRTDQNYDPTAASGLVSRTVCELLHRDNPDRAYVAQAHYNAELDRLTMLVTDDPDHEAFIGLYRVIAHPANKFMTLDIESPEVMEYIARAQADDVHLTYTQSLGGAEILKGNHDFKIVDSKHKA